MKEEGKGKIIDDRGKSRKCKIFFLMCWSLCCFSFGLVWFEPDCPWVHPCCIWDFVWISGNKVGCPTIPLEIILAKFQWRKKINGNKACFVCSKVVNFFERGV